MYLWQTYSTLFSSPFCSHVLIILKSLTYKICLITSFSSSILNSYCMRIISQYFIFLDIFLWYLLTKYMKSLLLAIKDFLRTHLITTWNKGRGTGTVARWVKLPSTVPYSICVPLWVLIAPVLIQLSANKPVKAVEDGSSTWAGPAPCGSTDRSFRFLASAWHSPGHCGYLESSQQREYLSFSLSSLTLPFKQTNQQIVKLAWCGGIAS